MPFEVFLDEDSGIVRVHVHGSATAADHSTVRQQVLKLCSERGSFRVLVDIRDLQVADKTTLECYSFGETLASANESRGVRFAYVLPNESDSRSNVSFISTVASNRGVLMCEFASVEEAEKWLQEQPAL